MTSKYQKTPFDKDHCLKMEGIDVSNLKGIWVDHIIYTKLKLSVVENQLCFVTSDGYFMPIARVSTIKNILEKT
jgi:hypothetical protein